MMNKFEYLANFYDEFVGADYTKIAHYIQHKLNQHMPNAHYGVDIGCGSGTLTYLLSGFGYDMIGIDHSEAMLSQAVSKSNGNNVLFVQQNMAEIELYENADFMVSSLDCINYLSDIKELKKLFKRCATFLNQNGILLFDFNSIYKYETILNNKNFVYETDDVFCVWENVFDGKNMHYDLTYFLNDGEHYKRFSEYQKQTFFTPKQIIDILENLGFDIISLEDDYEDKPIGDQTARIVLTAQKRS